MELKMKVNATIHLDTLTIDQILREVVEKQTGKKVKCVKFKIQAAQDDRFNYSPARLDGADIEVEFA